MKFDKFYACPYCGAALDPGEKCDCGVRENAQTMSDLENVTELSHEDKLSDNIYHYNPNKGVQKYE